MLVLGAKEFLRFYAPTLRLRSFHEGEICLSHVRHLSLFEEPLHRPRCVASSQHQIRPLHDERPRPRLLHLPPLSHPALLRMLPLPAPRHV